MDRQLYLEKCLPQYLEHDLSAYKESLYGDQKFLDCLNNELENSLKVAYQEDLISKRQFDYMWEKYIINYGVINE